MVEEILVIGGEIVSHTVVPIVGDGARLFRALSFPMYGTHGMANDVHGQGVRHVIECRQLEILRNIEGSSLSVAKTVDKKIWKVKTSSLAYVRS